jgi:hypothetical protein
MGEYIGKVSPEDCLGLDTRVSQVDNPSRSFRAVLEGFKRGDDGELLGVLRELPKIIRRKWRREPGRVIFGDTVIQARLGVVLGGGVDGRYEIGGVINDNKPPKRTTWMIQ